jgi:DNA helicase IV
VDEKIQAEEQDFLLRAIKALDEDHAMWSRMDPATGANAQAQRAIARRRDGRLKQIADLGDKIIIGRVKVDVEGRQEDVHIGEYPLNVEEREIAEWRAPIAAAFYQPTGNKYGKVTERRSITVRDRDVVRVEVDTFGTSVHVPSGGVIEQRKLPEQEGKGQQVAVPEAEPAIVQRLRAEETILEELSRSRDNQMRQVVATIQEDQDRAIRAASDVALFIEGGPGTGKTVVGLHRLAVLLYNKAMAGVARDALVIGPNPRFMEYVNQVLPSLGEDAVEMADVRSVCLGELPEALVSKLNFVDHTDPFVERVKGDALMVDLLREAAWTAPQPFAFVLVRDGARARFEEEEIRDLLESVKARVLVGAISVTDARRVLSQRLIELAAPRFRQSKDAVNVSQVQRMDRREAEAEARQAPNKSKAADRIFRRSSGRPEPDAEPAASPRLLGDQPQVEEIALRGNDAQMMVVVNRLLPLSDAEKVVRRVFEGGAQEETGRDISGALLRKYVLGMTQFDLGAVTNADIALLAAAEQILHGAPMKVGHVVVDEAQDISPVVWSLIRARVERNSVTVLGDLNQRTVPGACRTWEEAAGALGLTEWNQMSLELSYRVPKPILDFAKRALPDGSRVLAPLGLREGEEPVIDNIGHSPTLADIDNALRISGEGDLIGVVTTDPILLATVRDRTVFVKPHEAKGLEFDTVVVVEPGEWFDGTDEARRLLFIALSRPTKHLAVLHYLPLPADLR